MPETNIQLHTGRGKGTDVDSCPGLSASDNLSGLILYHRQKNGRSSHTYENGYHFLSNDGENKRLDLQHHIWYLTLDGKLGLAPPVEQAINVGRVLDLGTGTGIWATDFAEDHPEAEVMGTDVKMADPRFLPSNVTFLAANYEEEWNFPCQFDYIHSRMANSSVADWSLYIRNSFAALAPGGYLELQEFDLATSSGSLSPSHALHKSMGLIRSAAAKFNRPIIDLSTLPTLLTEAGFEDVFVAFKGRWPSNTLWPADLKEREIGRWNYLNVGEGIEGFLLGRGVLGLGLTREEIGTLAGEVKKDLADPEVHAYWPVVVVYGRKPDETRKAGRSYLGPLRGIWKRLTSVIGKYW
ncbi:S-adenosyl-L-methionine-dependent methyltransferase [Lasiosphaeria hispida]|uniref:S-adenosyl-L-methionine-dependent methyltransferase n=1 Tax=Lasiosphaeria hispida TaxID=260671 RepID=A0AAJ0H724_9PEZI|nr:S-adenosyl-L-methionine-dependent methyltransferase [Lasiosphaeria hispida]